MTAPTASKPSQQALATARAGGRHAALNDLPITSCPFTGDDPTSLVLRANWLRAHDHWKPRPTPSFEG